MDWISSLRIQQANFIQRLKSSHLPSPEIEVYDHEFTVISGNNLSKLRDFCWEMAEKYKRNNSVRKVFVDNLKGKLGEEVVKSRLGSLITEVDYEKRIGGDGKVDFTLTSDPNIGIQVKVRQGNFDTVRWSVSQEEVNKNAVVICILIQEEVNEAQSQYTLLTAGFLPTSMIEITKDKASLAMKDLLYSRGLLSFLESLALSSLASISEEYEPIYQTCRLLIEYSDDSQTEEPELITQITSSKQVQAFSIQESLALPLPTEEFPHLPKSLELLQNAIKSQQRIGICGDYDAHGMISTALLMRSLIYLGANVDYAIPSAMHEGYGINRRIVEEFHSEGAGLIITINNGICAFEEIARAREIGLNVIIIDHHDIPQQLPPANAILNPKLIPDSSPYSYLTGIGLAYILAISLAQELKQAQVLKEPLLDLLTIGMLTELDAPMLFKGVNFSWLQEGLQQILKSQLAGVQALLQVSGIRKINKTLTPDDVSFYLGFPMEAIGCIADPQIVIELLITDDIRIAHERAIQCEAVKWKCLEMCVQTEQEAIAHIEMRRKALHHEDVLVIAQPNWHFRIMRIVTPRLVERYGVPVFAGTYEDESHIRGFVRGIPGLNVSEALIQCNELLEKYCGNKRSGAFILPSENLEKFRSKLGIYSCVRIQVSTSSKLSL